MRLIDDHAKYFPYELTKRRASDSVGKLAAVLADAQVELNPHQVAAVPFARRRSFSEEAISSVSSGQMAYVPGSPERGREAADPSTTAQWAWQWCGLWLMGNGRLHEARLVFQALYNRMLDFQLEVGDWTHKGMTLVWISDCYRGLGYRVHAKRDIMLTLIEDAIRDGGKILNRLRHRLQPGGGWPRLSL